jgi:hypothetical protein
MLDWLSLAAWMGTKVIVPCRSTVVLQSPQLTNLYCGHHFVPVLRRIGSRLGHLGRTPTTRCGIHIAAKLRAEKTFHAPYVQVIGRTCRYSMVCLKSRSANVYDALFWRHWLSCSTPLLTGASHIYRGGECEKGCPISELGPKTMDTERGKGAPSDEPVVSAWHSQHLFFKCGHACADPRSVRSNTGREVRRRDGVLSQHG